MTDQTEEFEVQKIISKKLRENQWYYLVQWKDFDIQESTWEPHQNIS